VKISVKNKKGYHNPSIPSIGISRKNSRVVYKPLILQLCWTVAPCQGDLKEKCFLTNLPPCYMCSRVPPPYPDVLDCSQEGQLISGPLYSGQGSLPG